MSVTRTIWRDTALSVRIGCWDARACSGFFLWMLHMCWFSFWLSILVFLVCIVLEQFGISMPAALRGARTFFLPAVRHTTSVYAERRRLR